MQGKRRWLRSKQASHYGKAEGNAWRGMVYGNKPRRDIAQYSAQMGKPRGMEAREDARIWLQWRRRRQANTVITICSDRENVGEATAVERCMEDDKCSGGYF